MKRTFAAVLAVLFLLVSAPTQVGGLPSEERGEATCAQLTAKFLTAAAATLADMDAARLNHTGSGGVPIPPDVGAPPSLMMSELANATLSFAEWCETKLGFDGVVFDLDLDVKVCGEWIENAVTFKACVGWCGLIPRIAFPRVATGAVPAGPFPPVDAWVVVAGRAYCSDVAGAFCGGIDYCSGDGVHLKFGHGICLHAAAASIGWAAITTTSCDWG